jgi:hypothetical protein
MTYGEVKCDLGPLMFDMREEACFLVGFESVCESGGIYGRDQTRQQAYECGYCPHRDARGRTMPLGVLTAGRLSNV